jgi:hypothetical protein
VKTRTAFTFLAGAPLLAAAAGFFLYNWFQGQEKALYTQQEQAMAQDSLDWAREEKDRKVKAYQSARQLVQEHRQKLEAAWGGATEAACKDPHLAIAGMLEGLAQTCALTPGVTVRVDRFTEFEISVRWDGPLDVARMANVCFCLLPRATPFARALRFVQRGVIVAELDERAIDSIPDWTRASLVDIQNLLSTPQNSASQNGGGSKVGTWSTDFQRKLKDLSSTAEEAAAGGDGQRIQDAQKAFDQMLASHNQRLKSVLEMQDQAGRLADLSSADSLQSKLRLLRQAAVDLGQTRQFLLNQDSEFRQTFQSREVDPLFIHIQMRSLSERQARRRPYLEALFQAVEQRQNSAELFLTEMQRTWGAWSAAGTTIQFSTPEAQAAYRQASDQLSQATDRTSTAIRALNDWEAAR